MRNAVLAFFVSSLILVTVCLIIIGWPVELQAITDICTNAGTTPMDFALMVFIFGEFFLFMGIAFIAIAGRR